jgi:Homoserine dehydrogenase
VVTSDKWPVALHGTELAALARHQAVAFRAESTVMSGTPVLSALTEGLAGTVPVALRGVLNATANFVLSRMADGLSYEAALGEAQQAGLAEPDPAGRRRRSPYPPRLHCEHGRSCGLLPPGRAYASPVSHASIAHVTTALRRSVR